MAQLSTKRLQMVSWTEELAEAVLYDPSQLKTLLAATVAEGFPNDPVRNFVLPTTLDRVRRDPDYGLWSGLIIHTEDHIAIGSMGFKSPPDDKRTVEIGYDIVPAYQGQGYATEMARALVQWAFKQTSVMRITAECLPDNRASIRVLEKIGMQRVSEQEDILCWELRMPE